ncbi:Rhomboid-related protein 2 [Mactra antiquata]
MNYKCSECENPVRVMTSAPFRLAILCILVFVDTSMAVYRRFYETGVSKVGISAHCGGLLTGLLLGIPVMKNINILSWEKKIGWLTLGLYIIAVIACVLFNGLYPYYPDTDFTECC